MFDFSSVKVSDQQEEIWFRAETTKRQLAALAKRISDSDIPNEIINLEYFKTRISVAKNLDISEVERWLKNSWNTEKVLNENISIIKNTGSSFSMQWAFPQAYYSVFGSLLAHFKAVGYTQESHSAVIKQFGELIDNNRIPEGLSFCCYGGLNNITYHNISKPTDIKPMELNIHDNKTVDNQICQFLKATREIKLKEKAESQKYKTKRGELRKKLNPLLWDNVSRGLGKTTIIDLLYRKRIKANYQDIDTFNSTYFDGENVLTSLCNIVNSINLVNEAYIARVINLSTYNDILTRHLSVVDNEFPRIRFDIINNIIEAVNAR